jgi:hypothetical protein
MPITQQGQSRCSRYRWPDDPRWVYKTLTDAEIDALTASELRAAIRGSATLMREELTGHLCVFDAGDMEPLGDQETP